MKDKIILQKNYVLITHNIAESIKSLKFAHSVKINDKKEY